MNIRCSPTQIADALILSSMNDEWFEFLMNYEEQATLKSLDTIVLIVTNFASFFEKYFSRIYKKYRPSGNSFSEQHFLKFLSLMCEILSQKGDYFGFILACSFAYEVVSSFRSKFDCLHYESSSGTYLSGFVESRFKSFNLENDSEWTRFLDYSRNLNEMIYNRTFGPKTTAESNRRELRRYDVTETGTMNKLECADIDTGEEIKNTEHFNDNSSDDSEESDRKRLRRCDITETGSINKIECSNNDTEGVIRNSEHFNDNSDEYCDESNRRKRLKSCEHEIDVFNEFERSVSDTEEIKESDRFNDDTYVYPDEVETKIIDLVPYDYHDGGMTHKLIQEIGGRYVETDIDIFSSRKIGSRPDNCSSSDSDECQYAKKPFLNILMPDLEYKNNIFGLIQECVIEFEHNFENNPNNEAANTQIKNCASCSETVFKECEKKMCVEAKNVGELLTNNTENVETSFDNNESDRSSNSKNCDEYHLECRDKILKHHFKEWEKSFCKIYKNIKSVSNFFEEENILEMNS